MALVESFDQHKIYSDNCKDCILSKICDGSCLVNNYLLHGSIHHKPEVQCWWDILMFKECVRITQILGCLLYTSRCV